MGPFLGETYFYDDWQAWGIGIPAPLANAFPTEILANSREHISIEELTI